MTDRDKAERFRAAVAAALRKQPAPGFVVYPSGRWAETLAEALRVAAELSRADSAGYAARVEDVARGLDVARYRDGRRVAVSGTAK